MLVITTPSTGSAIPPKATGSKASNLNSMKAKNYQYIFLHFTLLTGGLIFQNLLYFFISALLVGILPRRRRAMGYYWLLSLAAMALALFLNPPQAAVQEAIAGVLPLGKLPFWLLVAIITSLMQAISATAANRLLSKHTEKKRIGAYLRR